MRRIMKPRAFTLVELLVVVAIVAVLIALLLPVLTKARRVAAQVACLSNLHQLGTAMIAYAHMNKGWLPAPACGAYPQPEDWVHWEPSREFSDSTILPFLGSDSNVLKCALGPPELQPGAFINPIPRPPSAPYPFSYSVNVLFTGVNRTSPGYMTAYWDPIPCKITQAKNPAQKILALEEDPRKITDGAWFNGSDPFGEVLINMLSARHDSGGREIGPGPSKDKRGNVVFADGHGEFIRRELTSAAAFIDPWFSSETTVAW